MRLRPVIPQVARRLTQPASVGGLGPAGRHRHLPLDHAAQLTADGLRRPDRVPARALPARQPAAGDLDPVRRRHPPLPRRGAGDDRGSGGAEDGAPRGGPVAVGRPERSQDAQRHDRARAGGADAAAPARGDRTGGAGGVTQTTSSRLRRVPSTSSPAPAPATRRPADARPSSLPHPRQDDRQRDHDRRRRTGSRRLRLNPTGLTRQPTPLTSTSQSTPGLGARSGRGRRCPTAGTRGRPPGPAARPRSARTRRCG